MLSKKIILTGNFGVGKTAILEQYTADTYREAYLSTIGLQVKKKITTILGQEQALFIWDICGEISQRKIPKSYFLGTDRVYYVIDLSRPCSFEHIEKDINYLKSILLNTSVKIIGNKIDLVSDSQLKSIKQDLPYSIDELTSAKTGKNIDSLFNDSSLVQEYAPIPIKGTLYTIKGVSVPNQPALFI